MRYCVLFPQAKNVHLIKDVGMIAYKLNKQYDFDSYIACYNNDSYDYINGLLKGLKLDFIEKKHNNDIIDGSLYLRKNSKNIDVLQLFHVTLRSVVYAVVYKHYNKKGEIFLKLDCTENLLNKIKALSITGRKFFNYFFNKVDLIGVEQQKLFHEIANLLPQFKNKFKYIPNGIDYDLIETKDLHFSDKKNYVLHVGRLGAEEKKSELLVEAFDKLTKTNSSNNWTLVLVGESTEAFNEYLSNRIAENPLLKERIKLTGPIADRNELNKIYKDSKIFCLTSDFESFGIVLIEAAALGNAILSTDVGIANEITENGGAIINHCDLEDLLSKLSFYMKDDILIDLSNSNIAFVKENYNWDKIVTRLYNEIVKNKETL